MDFIKRKKIKPDFGSISELYPHDLQMYTRPPDGEITLMEFEQFAVDRLKVLRSLELINLKGHAKTSEEFKRDFCEELKKQDLKLFLRVITGTGTGEKDSSFEARRLDHISHYILRLAYCRTESLRRWFISRELDLFRFRWQNLTEKGQEAFVKLNNLDFNPISPTELQKLVNSSNGMLITDVTYYQVYFTQVVDLVRHRNVFLHHGFAYIKNSDIISVLSTVLRTELSRDLIRTSRELPFIEEDDRISPLLKSLHHCYTGEDYGEITNTERIELKALDSLSKKSYPLCMKQVHDTLRALHHLRHGARLQYGLFLKGIGVTLEDAMTFWRDEFTKKVDLDKFEKMYSYSIRYNYGKEGKRANYTPYSCLKIITGSVGPGDQHGCPFKHNDMASLRNILQQANVPPSGIQEMCELVNKGHYQIACTRFFEYTHDVPSVKGINHPNQYFIESQTILKGKTNVTGAKHKEVTNVKPRQSIDNDVWGDSGVFDNIDM